MKNILQFIDSKDIRDYNKDTEFDPIEQLIIVLNSVNTNIEDKIDQLKYIYYNYPPESLMSSNKVSHDSIVPIDINFRRRIKILINLWEEYLSDKKDSKYILYTYTYGIDDSLFDNPEYFNTYADALHELRSIYESELEDGKITIGAISGISDEVYNDNNHIKLNTYHFNRSCELYYIDIQSEDLDGISIADLQYGLYMNIQVPFEYGDIVKINDYLFEPTYGVLRTNNLPRKVDFNLTTNADFGDMIRYFDTYNSKDEIQFYLGKEVSPFHMEKANIDDLTGDNTVLKIMSKIRTGEIDYMELLMRVYDHDELVKYAKSYC